MAWLHRPKRTVFYRRSPVVRIREHGANRDHKNFLEIMQGSISSVQKTRVGQIQHGFTRRMHKRLTVNDYFDEVTSMAYRPPLCCSSAKALLTALESFNLTGRNFCHLVGTSSQLGGHETIQNDPTFPVFNFFDQHIKDVLSNRRTWGLYPSKL